MVKRREKCKGDDTLYTVTHILLGQRWQLFQALREQSFSETIQTAFIERVNLTIRQGVAPSAGKPGRWLNPSPACCIFTGSAVSTIWLDPTNRCAFASLVSRVAIVRSSAFRSLLNREVVARIPPGGKAFPWAYRRSSPFNTGLAGAYPVSGVCDFPVPFPIHRLFTPSSQDRFQEWQASVVFAASMAEMVRFYQCQQHSR